MPLFCLSLGVVVLLGVLLGVCFHRSICYLCLCVSCRVCPSICLCASSELRRCICSVVGVAQQPSCSLCVFLPNCLSVCLSIYPPLAAEYCRPLAAGRGSAPARPGAGL